MSLTDLLDDSLASTYEVERELTGGGMSRVLVARDRRLGRPVVLKLLRDDLAAGVSVERFRREILLSAGLQHPHIVPVLSAGEANGRPYLVMPYVEGESVRARLRSGPLRIPDAVNILRDVARALAYAHSRGVIHRDIKPDNILLAAGTAMVSDFGVAKAISAARGDQVVNASLTYEGTSLGTPHYMAPEQITADPDADSRGDLYAFGATAYELLTGAPPFPGGTLQEIFTAHLTSTPVPPMARRSEISPGLSDLIMRCLAKAPADRPASAAEIADALSDPQVVSGAFSSAADGLPPARLPRRWGMGALAGAVLLLILLGGAGAWVASRAAPPPPTVAAAPSLAVLPLVYVGADASRAGIAEGVTSELTSALAGVPGLRVASRAAATRLQQRLAAGEPVDGTVTMFVEGIVQREGRRIRVDARLVDAVDGFMIWGGSWESPEAELLPLQHRLAAALRTSVEDRLAADTLRNAGSSGSPGRGGT